MFIGYCTKHFQPQALVPYRVIGSCQINECNSSFLLGLEVVLCDRTQLEYLVDLPTRKPKVKNNTVHAQLKEAQPNNQNKFASNDGGWKPILLNQIRIYRLFDNRLNI